MKIHFAADHAGFEMKNELLAFVRDKLGYEVVDHGAHILDPDDDFPDYVKPAVEAVSESGDDRAVILGGSGTGEAMAANRVDGIYAAVYYGGDPEIVRLSREHNNTNVLSLGARFLTLEEAKQAVKTWLATPFSEIPKYQRRIDKLH